MDILVNSFQQDRRISLRHDVKTALRVQIWKSNIPEQRAECVNLSECGIFFTTRALVRKGEAIQILVEMPQEISGVAPTKWRCTGRVVRVQPADSRTGKLRVGVRFDCYEILRAPPAAELTSGVLHER